MIPQTSGMDGRWNEAMSKAVHRSKRDKTGCIAVIIDKGCSGHCGTGSWFNRDDGNIGAVDFVQDKGEGNASKITPPTCTGCHHIDLLLSKFLQLFLGLEADDRLVHKDMVEDTSQRVLRVLRGDGIFNGFANRKPETSWGVWILFQSLSSCIRVLARAGNTVCSPDVHHQSAIRFLIIADPHHIDLAFQTEETAGKSECASPLSCTGLCRNAFGPKDFVVVGLGNGRIGFVAPWGAYPFILIVNSCRGSKGLFQSISSMKGSGPPEKKFLHHSFRDINPSRSAV